MTSIQVNETDSRKTLESCLASGINFLDTAYCYGADGISEVLIGESVRGRRDEVVIATKGGIHWDENGARQQDARPETLHKECRESLRRLQTDYVDLLYLHAPDPNVPLSETAGALVEMREAGLARSIGISNVNLDQLTEFHEHCPVSAVQPPYNMLQREIEADLIPWCSEHEVSVFVYWPLMKGLLAGKLGRDHRFDPQDGRAKYPMFQGAEWQKNQDFVDRLREIAAEHGKTVAQVVVNWTIHREGVTGALCGAKRAYQIEETAGAMGWHLSADDLQNIDEAIRARGTPVTRGAV